MTVEVTFPDTDHYGRFEKRRTAIVKAAGKGPSVQYFYNRKVRPATYVMVFDFTTNNGFWNCLERLAGIRRSIRNLKLQIS
jgi:hypothetical protein